MLNKFEVTLSALCFLSGVSVAQIVEGTGTSSEMPVIEKGTETIITTSDKENLKHYTFRVGKIRMKDNHNTPTITKEIRDAYLIRFLIPSRKVTEEHPFYSFKEGIGEWCKYHLDLHIGITKQSNPSLYLIGGNFEITNFVDLVFGAAFSNDLNYRDPMYYTGITFDSQLFYHLIDMIQEGIKTAEK